MKPWRWKIHPDRGWVRRRAGGVLVVLAGLLLAGCVGQSAVVGERGGDALPGDVFPPPVPARREGFGLAAACPNPEGIEYPPSVGAAELMEVVTDHMVAVAKGEFEQAKRTADPAFWPILDQMKSARPLSSGDVEDIDPTAAGEVGPARASPHADLIASNCGDQVLEASWWVQVLPRGARTAGDAPSLVGNFYLIKRQGHWLIWASE